MESKKENIATSSELLEQGNIFFDNKDYKKALEYYIKAALKTKENIEASLIYYSIGNAQYNLREYSKALDNYSHALTKINYSEVTTFQKNLKENILYSIGNCYYALGQYEEALYYYTKVIAQNDKYILAYKARADVHRALGNYSDAVSDYNKIKKLQN